MKTASEFVADCECPVFFFSGNGCPGGQSIAILEGTELPVDLDEVVGNVDEHGYFEANNLTAGPGAYDWKFSDFNGSLIYRIQLFDDREIYEQQEAELDAYA